MSCMYFHSLPSARVISVGPVCDPQNQVGVISLTGIIQKDKVRRVDTADTVCVQKYGIFRVEFSVIIKKAIEYGYIPKSMPIYLFQSHFGTTDFLKMT